MKRNPKPLIAIVGLVCVLLALLNLGRAALPFATYEINSFQAMPHEGCPGDIVKVEINRTITKPWLGSVDTVEVYSSWERDGTGATPGGQILVEPFSGIFGEADVLSNFERTAPDRPGKWHLSNEITIRGSVLGKPKSVVAKKVSEGLFTVHEPGTHGCAGESREGAS